MAMWEGTFFKAQVTKLWSKGRSAGCYDVYFIEDQEVLKRVPEDKLQAAPRGAVWATMTREDFVGHNFKHKKARKGTPRSFGEFTVASMGTGRLINKYLCRSLEDCTRTFNFDMGYVQDSILQDLFPDTYQRMTEYI